MKKKVLIILALVWGLSISADAKTLNYSEYDKLGISHSYIVGKYIFNLDNGFSPNLRDIMRASQSIPKDEPTTLYEIIIDGDYFSQYEVYSDTEHIDTHDFHNFDVDYVYRSSLYAARKDFDTLSS